MSFTLILFIWQTTSMTMTSVPGFATIDQCTKAATAVKAIDQPGWTAVKTVCLEQGKP